MAQFTWKMSLFGLFSSKVTEDETAERFLKLSEMCMEQAQELTISVGDHAQFQRKFNESSIATKINHWQCRYLRKKLEKAIESVRSAHFPYLEPLFYGEHEESTPDYTAIELEIFKVLYALAKEVENFIKSCCKDAWSQAALTLSNVSDHVLSIAFNLELWTILYSESKSKKLIARARQSFTIAEVDKIYKTEVEKMKKKAFQDRENLLIKLDAELYTKKETSMEYQLAAFLLHRLESRISPGCMPVVGFQRITSGESGELPSSGSQSGLSLKVFGSLRQSGILGKGSAATVYKAKWLGGKVAMKTFYGAGNHFFKKEVSILRGLSHPNIISLLWSTVDRRKCSIIVERMDGDLHTLMQVRLEGRGDQESPFCILEAVDIMLQVGGGMLYLHEMKIVHRDLKSTNILVKHVREHNPEIEYFQVKVADFGLSKTKEKSVTYSNQTINMGTPRWMAPEMIKTLDNASGSSGTDARTMKFPFKCDVYSFGMVCYEILTGEIPFSSITNLVDVKKTVLDVKKTVLDGGRPTLPEECPTLLEALIEKCWTQDACQRPCFGQICAKLRHLKCLLLLSSLYSIALPNDFGALESESDGCSNQDIEPLEESISETTSSLETISSTVAMSSISTTSFLSATSPTLTTSSTSAIFGKSLLPPLSAAANSIEGGPSSNSLSFDLINNLLATPFI